MAISKKIRFEVFKRDGFRCAYCGKAPPLVILEVDHIDPKSKGGKDHINNLLTACFDCNRGKKNIPLEKIPQQLNDNLDVLKEKEEQLRQYRKFADKIEKRNIQDMDDICKIYSDQYPEWHLTEHFRNSTLRRFLSLLPRHEIIDAFYIGISRYPTDKDKVIPYFCGICWNRIRGTKYGDR